MTSHAPVLLYSSARELELEDRQSRLQQELRDRMNVDGNVIFQGDVTSVCVLDGADADPPALRSDDLCRSL